MTTRLKYLLLAFLISTALWGAIITGVVWYFSDGTSAEFTATTR